MIYRCCAQLDKRRFAVFATLLSVADLLITAPLPAAGATIPTPRVMIYPGDRIDDAMLEDNEADSDASTEQRIFQSRSGLIGKTARRTLLPGQPIPLSAVENPKIVVVGAQVKIVFMESGLVITAFGMAMQPGGVGDLVRVRNQDSGLTVTGRVQPDGSIRVSEG